MNHLERKYQHYSWLTDCQGRKLIPMLFNYIFIFIWYRQRKLSKATRCCVRTKEEPSMSCSEQVQDGSSTGSRLLGYQYNREFLFLWNTCGSLISCHIESILTEKEKELHPPLSPKKIPNIAVVCYSMIYFHFYFLSVAAKERQTLQKWCQLCPAHTVGTPPSGDTQISPWYSSLVFLNSICSWEVTLQHFRTFRAKEKPFMRTFSSSKL